MPTITKRELVNELSDELGMTQAQVSKVLEGFLATVMRHVCEGDVVTFRTFGNFEPKVAKGKLGRNPNQPEVVVKIPDRCVVKFRPGGEFKESVAQLPVEKLAKKKR